LPDPRHPALGASSKCRKRIEEAEMNPNHSISYGLAQARIADLHEQARRQSLVRAARSVKAQSGSQPRSSRVPGHLRLVHRRRVTTAIG
jgi:hypothetical protein